jgi:two-component system, HptB-dependent secretion and biofilm response regulator
MIDNNELNRIIIKKILEEEGTTVYLAEDGDKGIEILKKKTKIDLILLDLHMPKMDGFKTAEKIKGLFNKTCKKKRAIRKNKKNF